MKSKKDSNVLTMTDSQVWLAEQQPTGFLVALWLDSETATKLALPGGEPAESLHITIAYCGNADEMSELLQARAITAVADAVQYWTAPEGKIAGYGRFAASESSDGQDVFYATPDLPQLAYLRERIVCCLSDQGVPVSQNHGYSPHITLAYLDSEAKNPVDKLEPLDLNFSGTTIVVGSRKIEIPFWSEVESTISMSETDEVPPEAPLDALPARALFFGSFDKEWIPFLPKPGHYLHNSYGDMNLSSQTYEQMLENFNNRVFKQDLPIRATHTPADGGAVGWIKPGGMRLADDGSLEVKPEWNELGKGLVDDDRFRYVSAEFCKEWTNPVTQEKITNVAVGLALVTRPHFKTDVLKPLSASEAHAFADAILAHPDSVTYTGVETEAEATTTITYNDSDLTVDDSTLNVLGDEAVSGDAGEGTKVDNEKIENADTTKEVTAPIVDAAKPVADLQLPAINLNDLSQVVITAEQRTKERQMFSDLTDRVTLAERARDNAVAEANQLRKERRIERWTAEVTGRALDNNVPWFGDVKANVEQLVSLSEMHGDDSQQVKWTLTQKRNEAQAIRNTKIFDPISLAPTDEGTSATAHVAQLAEQLRSSNRALTQEQAVSQVYSENPELYARSLRVR